APRRIVPGAERRRANLLGRKADAFGEEGHVDPPLIGAAAARAGAIDHDLAVAEGDRATVEEAPSSKALVDAWHTRQRGEEREGRNPRRHDAVEHGLKLGWKGRRHRIDAALGFTHGRLLGTLGNALPTPFTPSLARPGARHDQPAARSCGERVAGPCPSTVPGTRGAGAPPLRRGV